MTIAEPGAVATELSDYIFDEEAWERMARIMSVQALKAEHIANSMVYATRLSQRVSVNAILIMPNEPA